MGITMDIGIVILGITNRNESIW